jgi:magnesium-protoporphyrin O-methyltransferase
MDSLIHYKRRRRARAAGLAQRTRRLAWPSPSRPARRLLMAMHAVGRLFPRGDRAPAIVPVAEKTAAPLAAPSPAWRRLAPGRTQRVSQRLLHLAGLGLGRR